MSMIIEQIKRLKDEADLVECTHDYTAKLLREAANTIEQLAAKVRAENNISQPCEDAIPIPEGATNGDMIKALFPTEYGTLNFDIHRGSWWNSPYRQGETDE